MHDPMTVAFDIKNPFARKSHGYRPNLATIWHVDPERDGTDDSCGWFMRSRHGNQETLKAIVKAFEFDWDAEYGGWFSPNGAPLYSPHAITLGMFHAAARCHFGNWRQADRFMRKHLLELLWFAENPTDSLHPAIIGKYGFGKREDRIESMAHVVYGYILRKTRPWYRSPRWHVWHWRIDVHPVQQFKRWAFSRCAGCGGRFKWGYSPTTHTWHNTGPRWFRGERDVWHSECLNSDAAAAARTSAVKSRSSATVLH